MSRPSKKISVYRLKDSCRSIDFGGDWKFHLGDDVPLAHSVQYDDSSWHSISLPHDFSIEQDFSDKVKGEVGHLPGGVGFYRKAFILPAEFAGKHISIDFGGVYMDSYTYLNGEFIGNYPNGYMPFSYDISDKLNCDGVTKNVIAVKAACVATAEDVSSRWYSGAGIYRDVLLTVTGKVYVPQYGTTVTTPNIEAEYQKDGIVKVNVKTSVKNSCNKAASVKVRHSIIDYRDGNLSGTAGMTEETEVEPGQTLDFVNELTADHPLLWSVRDPNLYLMRTEVVADGEVVDRYDSRFGFRWFSFNNKKGFSLNGERLKLHGVCMHHDQGALGAVANEAAISRQIRIMKEMGANSIRVTHNPAAENLLKQCDEQGVLVIEEAFDTWYGGKRAYDYSRFFGKACTHTGALGGTTWAQFDLQQMVRRGINYPSIIMWSLGNEIGETDDESGKGLDTVKKLIQWTKEIDASRPATMGIDAFNYTAAADCDKRGFIDVANELDVVGINYAVRSDGSANYDGYHEKFPDWIIYGSETSSSLSSRGYYSDPYKLENAQFIDEYQVSSYDNYVPGHGAPATPAWIVDRNREWVCGQFIWTGFDYIGEPSPFSFEASGIPKNSYFGIVDTAGFKKDDYYLYQSQWLDVAVNPMVHIMPHWNFECNHLRDKVTVDGKIPVRVYSNAPKVELFVDDASLGEKRFAAKTTDYGKAYQQQSDTSDRLYLEWKLAYGYKPGQKIVAKAKSMDGRVIACDTVVTAGETAGIRLSADRQIICADGKDLCYITVEVTDSKGNIMPTAMNDIRFSLSGQGEIVGVDNGNSASWERYKDTNGIYKRKAFNGKALVIVQSATEGGSFSLEASGEGIGSKTITVYTEN